MIEALQALQKQAGATFTPIADEADQSPQVAVSFGNDAQAFNALQTGVAVCDRSHWGRLLVSDNDRVRFLHNQTTNDFMTLQAGQGCDTVFVTSTGRTIDLVTAYVLEDAILLLVSPNRRRYLMEWMDRFIFFADRVTLKDLTDTTATLTLIGPESTALLERLGTQAIANQPYASHTLVTLADIPTRVAIGSGLTNPGYNLIVDAHQAAPLWQTLVSAGAVPLGEQVWEQLRIEQGRPVPDHELTEEFNPLEAGLWHTISLTKGCYIGQETIARLHTYRGVKQQLWGVRLTQPVPPGTPLTTDDERVGQLTSCLITDEGILGLAYIRTKAAQAGLNVTAGDSQGELVDLPFIRHEYL
jgi:folate-binding protein YgfZ